MKLEKKMNQIKGCQFALIFQIHYPSQQIKNIINKKQNTKPNPQLFKH